MSSYLFFLLSLY